MTATPTVSTDEAEHIAAVLAANRLRSAALEGFNQKAEFMVVPVRDVLAVSKDYRRLCRLEKKETTT